MLGLDASLEHGPLEVNLQYLHRDDDRPTFTFRGPPTDVDGGLAELVVRPVGSRWHGFALYNLVTADTPILSVRLGELGPLRDLDRRSGLPRAPELPAQRRGNAGPDAGRHALDAGLRVRVLARSVSGPPAGTWRGRRCSGR